jgi:hypothetical protein
MATGGLVPPLLELLGAPPAAVSPLLRAKLLEVIRVLYEHYPRPKEFIIKYKIQVGGLVVAARVFWDVGRGHAGGPRP